MLLKTHSVFERKCHCFARKTRSVSSPAPNAERFSLERHHAKIKCVFGTQQNIALLEKKHGERCISSILNAYRFILMNDLL
mmetsp:Transcript_16519/g.24518  ORF Transcript_16519/g.24518 Transcript_16519/m.24518 type:complete len:81 (-) Transcript_16519:28-270(-)